jgi:hypothetical protein
MPRRLQGVFQSTLLKLARMFSEECRRGSTTIRTAESGVTCPGGWLKGQMEVVGEAAGVVAHTEI